MVKTLSAEEARKSFVTLLGQVHSRKDTVIVEKRGKPIVALIDLDRYQTLVEKRERGFRVLDRIWARNRNKDPRRAYRDATQAVAEVRVARRGRPRSSGMSPQKQALSR